MRLTGILVALLLGGCAFVAVERQNGDRIIAGEAFRSGEYTVTDDSVSMKTETMSPVLGGVVAGAIAAGLPGAAVGGGAGLLSEGVDLLVDPGLPEGNEGSR